jgi:hypothetical protein
MMHPSPEKWMSYLYGELPAASKAELKEHLLACAQCREQVASWESTMAGLNDWQLTPAAATPTPMRRSVKTPVLKWALAALVVLGLGFGIGRGSAPAPDLEAIRAAIEPGLRTAVASNLKQQVLDEVVADWRAALSGSPADLRSESRRQLRLAANQWTARAVEQATAENQRLLLDLAEDIQSSRRDEQQTLLTMFERAERQRQLDYVNLRRALETVAVVADDKFNRTESQLGEFVSYVQNRSLWDSSGEPASP